VGGQAIKRLRIYEQANSTEPGVLECNEKETEMMKETRAGYRKELRKREDDSCSLLGGR
jgi:hypothetical protein